MGLPEHWVRILRSGVIIKKFQS